jgi:DNA-directed RNA polymerase subunit RPC12/RpoP
MSPSQEKIDQIRKILDALGDEQVDDNNREFLQNFDALELPNLISSIIDHLQPELKGYEAAIYWHLFRKSILATGQQYVRASVRGLQEGVIRSSSGQSDSLSYSAVQNALARLEQLGAVQKAGDTNREGTLYKICLPEEIKVCQGRIKEATPAPAPKVDVERELDYYNVTVNRLKVFERDEYKCYNCGRQLTRFTATLDHIQPISKGGDNSLDNLKTACLHCNSRRGNRPVMDSLTGQDN